MHKVRCLFMLGLLLFSSNAFSSQYTLEYMERGDSLLSASERHGLLYMSAMRGQGFGTETIYDPDIRREILAAERTVVPVRILVPGAGGRGLRERITFGILGSRAGERVFQERDEKVIYCVACRSLCVSCVLCCMYIMRPDLEMLSSNILIQSSMSNVGPSVISDDFFNNIAVGPRPQKVMYKDVVDNVVGNLRRRI